MPEIHVGAENEYGEGGRKVITTGNLEIGVFRIKGEFYAYENFCAHMGGPVCQGRIFKRVEENVQPDGKSLGLKFSEDHTHIVCPWHGYEYDLETGCVPAKPTLRLRKIEVVRRAGEVYVVV